MDALAEARTLRFNLMTDLKPRRTAGSPPESPEPPRAPGGEE
jgi:hypothetical protein